MRFLHPLCLALLIAAAAFPAKAEDVKLVDLLPEDTVLYVQADDLSKSWEVFQKSSLYDIWKEESVQKFYKALKLFLEDKAEEDPKYKELRKEFKEKVGVELDEIHKPFIKGRATLAVVGFELPENDADGEWPSLDVLAVVDYDTDTQIVAKMISFGVEWVKKKGGTVEAKKIGGVDVQIITPADDAQELPAGLKVHVATKEGRLYLATSEGSLKRIFESSKSGKGLSQCPQYITCRKAVGSKSEIAFGFVNLKAIWKRITPKLDAESKENFEHLGLFGIEALAASSSFRGKGIRDQFFISMPGERKGVQKILTLPETKLKSLRYAPAKVGSFGSMGFDLKVAYDEAMRMLKTLKPEDYAKFEEKRAKAEEDLGIKFSDLAASLGTEFSTFSRLPEKGKKEITLTDLFRYTIMISLRDAKTFETGIAKILKEFGAEVTQKEHHGFKINQISFPSDANAVFKTAAYAIHDGMLFISIPGDDLFRLAKEQATGAPTLASTGAFEKQLKSYPAGFSGFGHTNLAGHLRMLWQFAQPLLKDQLREGGRLTMKDLPDIDAVCKHLSPMSSVMYSDKTGLKMVYDSPMGSLANLLVLGSGIALAIPAMQEAEAAARRAQCASTLKRIHGGILRFKKATGKYPEQLDELVKSKTKYLEGEAPLVSPADPFPEKENGVEYSYIYVYANVLGEAEPSKTIVAYNKNPIFNERKARNVLFLDGHVEMLKEVDFRKQFKELRKRLKKHGIDAYIGWGKYTKD